MITSWSRVAHCRPNDICHFHWISTDACPMSISMCFANVYWHDHRIIIIYIGALEVQSHKAGTPRMFLCSYVQICQSSNSSGMQMLGHHNCWRFVTSYSHKTRDDCWLMIAFLLPCYISNACSKLVIGVMTMKRIPTHFHTYNPKLFLH